MAVGGWENHPVFGAILLFGIATGRAADRTAPRTPCASQQHTLAAKEKRDANAAMIRWLACAQGALVQTKICAAS